MEIPDTFDDVQLTANETLRLYLKMPPGGKQVSEQRAEELMQILGAHFIEETIDE